MFQTQNYYNNRSQNIYLCVGPFAKKNNGSCVGLGSLTVYFIEIIMNSWKLLKHCLLVMGSRIIKANTVFLIKKVNKFDIFKIHKNNTAHFQE